MNVATLRSEAGRVGLPRVVVLMASLLAQGVLAQETSVAVPKQVHLVVDGERLVASNVRFSRFDELRLAPRETIREMEEGNAVILVVTTRRIIGYGVVSGWRAIDRIPNERMMSVSAQDYAGLVVTSERFLNFNGQSGVWGERDRRVSQ